MSDVDSDWSAKAGVIDGYIVVSLGNEFDGASMPLTVAEARALAAELEASALTVEATT